MNFKDTVINNLKANVYGYIKAGLEIKEAVLKACDESCASKQIKREVAKEFGL